MAKVEIVDEVVSKKLRKKLENPLEKRQKMPTFEDKYEDSLKQKLFEEDLKRMQNKGENDDDSESKYYEASRTLTHHKRDGE